MTERELEDEFLDENIPATRLKQVMNIKHTVIENVTRTCAATWAGSVIHSLSIIPYSYKDKFEIST